MKEIVEDIKSRHEREMKNYSQQVRDYVDKYGQDKSDYLNHRITMSNYHRGAYNAMVELQKRTGN